MTDLPGLPPDTAVMITLAGRTASGFTTVHTLIPKY